MDESTASLSDYREQVETELQRIEVEMKTLKHRRNYYLSQRQRLDMSDVLECIEESGLSANEVMEILVRRGQ